MKHFSTFVESMFGLSSQNQKQHLSTCIEKLREVDGVFLLYEGRALIWLLFGILLRLLGPMLGFLSPEFFFCHVDIGPI